MVRNVVLPLGIAVLSAASFIGLIAYIVGEQRWAERSDEVIARTYAVVKLDLDMETSVRGFLLAGNPAFLDPYEVAGASLEAERHRLRELVADNPMQAERVDRIGALQARWDEYAAAQIAAKRAHQDEQVGVRANEGRRLKDAVRAAFDDLLEAERRLKDQRSADVRRTTLVGVAGFATLLLVVGGLLAWRGRSDLLQLSDDFGGALAERQRHADVLQAEAWLREAQTGLSSRLAGERELARVAHAGLDAIVEHAGAVVGALYVPQPEGGFRRLATWGWSQGGGDASVPADRLLVAEAAQRSGPIRLDEVPPGYLRVATGVAEGDTASAIVAPVRHEGRLAGVLEFGFLRGLQPRDVELAQVCGPILGAAIEAAQLREKLQEMLHETQQLNEELQVQQEELRTANEELEEQSRALEESQVNLENQQAELEQTNQQLAEQAQALEEQRDAVRAAHRELERRAEDLQRASRYKSEFLANMSHELRTPLNSSLILARLLADNERGNLDAEQVKFAESIYSAGNDLLTLINDILDIAKVEAGKLELRPETTAVPAIVQTLRGMFTPLAEDKGLALAFEIDPAAPATLFTDRQRVEQVLRNLLSNGLKFTERGSVSLRISAAGADRVRFDVRDSGIGIDPAQHDLIFEAFQQADGTISRRYGGTGLGLSISRDLARMLGGDLTVASAPGQGSTFSLELPVQLAVAPAAPPPLPMAARGPSAPIASSAPLPSQPPAVPAFPDDRDEHADGRRTVLLVEDDRVFARILYDLAHELGFRCVVAHQAEDGIALARAQRPDAVLLDMRLPDGTGLMVLQRLKDDPATRHLPVHILSVEDQSETALQLGAIGYATKPATREQLRDVFGRLETKLSQKVKRVLVVEDDPRQRESMARLIGDEDVQITQAASGAEALQALAEGVYDCMVIDLVLPDMGGQELLRRMASGESRSFPPVVVYTGRNLSREEEAELLRYSRSIIIKGARSPERLLDEVTLFLHRVEADLSAERQRMLRTARSREKAFESRRILVVDDDVRNIFALTSALEHKGAEVLAARNGVEALDQLSKNDDIDVVLMDVMMPEMDGYTAMREIRRNPAWQKLPVIAITAKAMKDDQERCLAAGANDYLAKPIELDRLFSLIRVWMPKLERL
nr:response regulator [Ramlibacter algicola]